MEAFALFNNVSIWTKQKPTKMYKAKYLSPMIPSYNIEKTVSFFTNLLDFKVGRDDKTYVILYKDNSTVHILRAGSDIGEMEFYLVVDDIEKVWNNMKDKLEGIKVKEPFDREYGMREVHVIVPKTKTLMFIGQEIS
jgi:hypothetical protein